MRPTYAAGLVLVVTDRSQLPPGRSLLEVVGAALQGGAHGVLVRERDLPAGERYSLVEAIGRLCAQRGALHLVASPLPGQRGRSRSGPRAPHDPGAGDLDPSGVHLRRDEPLPPNVDRQRTLVGRSCHDLTELRRACDEGLDHVTLSPVTASPSKPGHGPALGVNGLRGLVTAARNEYAEPPVMLALGGVDETNAGSWVEAGADGVAVMGAVMRAADPVAVTRAIVVSVTTAREAA